MAATRSAAAPQPTGVLASRLRSEHPLRCRQGARRALIPRRSRLPAQQQATAHRQALATAHREPSRRPPNSSRRPRCVPPTSPGAPRCWSCARGSMRARVAQCDRFGPSTGPTSRRTSGSASSWASMAVPAAAPMARGCARLCSSSSTRASRRFTGHSTATHEDQASQMLLLGGWHRLRWLHGLVLLACCRRLPTAPNSCRLRASTLALILQATTATLTASSTLNGKSCERRSSSCCSGYLRRASLRPTITRRSPS